MRHCADPYQSIGFASKQAQEGDTIYTLTDGLGDISGGYTIEAARGTELSPITIKPAPGHSGLYSTTAFVGWRVLGSQNFIIEGFEFDGNSDRVDHWDLVSKGVWTQSTVQPMGGIAINISTGSNITIQKTSAQPLSYAGYPV